MTTTTAVQLFLIDAYELQCSARSLDGGKFAPVLVATKQARPTRARVIDVGRGDDGAEASAIGAARAQGVEWIANYGGRAPV